jgi:cell division protein FtsA
MFSLPVRCAAPRGLEDMPEELSQPEYATVVGLLLYGAHARRMAAQRPATLVAKLKSMFAGQ